MAQPVVTPSGGQPTLPTQYDSIVLACAIDPNGKLVPLQIGTDGNLSTDATLTGSVTVGAVSIQDHTTGSNYATVDASGNLHTIVAALPAGSNTIGNVGIVAGSATIGAVTQASGPWTTNLTKVNGSTIALGQALMAASLPVALASDQPTISVSFTNAVPAGSNTIGNVGIVAGSATIGAVTQASGPWTVNVTQIAGAAPAQGHGVAATALRVELPTDGTGVVGLNAGSNVIGAVTQSAGPWTTNLTQVAGSAISQGHGTAATAIRVELPTDGSGVVGLNTGSNVIGAVTQSAGPWTQNITQVAGAAISQGHGTAATAIRVELPTDGTGVVGLNAGSATIGAVTQASGPWTVNLTQVAGSAISQGHGTAASAIRVELPTDGTGQVNINNNVGSTLVRIAGNAPTSATQLASNTLTRGVLYKADDANTGDIYIGESSSITHDAGNSTSGFHLKAGQSVFLPVSNTNVLYHIASASSQAYVLLAI